MNHERVDNNIVETTHLNHNYIDTAIALSQQSCTLMSMRRYQDGIELSFSQFVRVIDNSDLNKFS